ncbi:MAG: four helix bundle protein [Chitinophagaceae bacterium]|nr:four helix bundle protein [Chitinophagaceae bacterium]
MYLELSHTKLEVFKTSKAFVLECYRVTRNFPAHEKYNLTSQIRRAALSVHLNMAEGASRNSPVERKRYYVISRGSVIEVDTGIDIAEELGYCTHEATQELGKLIISSFSQLSMIINKAESFNRNT